MTVEQATITLVETPGKTTPTGAAALSRRALLIPPGYALVPLEPNDPMQLVGAENIRINTTVINKLFTCVKVFRAMAQAAMESALDGAVIALRDAMQTPESQLQLRAEFDAWHKQRFGYLLPPSETHDDNVEMKLAQARWEAWRESRAI